MNKIIRYFLVCVLLPVISMLLVGCKKDFKTVIIEPDSKRFVYWKTKSGHNTSTCGIGSCFATMATSCDPGLTEDDSTIVSYFHRHDSGTQPCPCWEYVNCVYRGYVGFNVSQLEGTGLGAATLKWDPDTERAVGSAVSNNGNCIARMYRATEPWQTEQTTTGEEISSWGTGDANPPVGITVSDTVRGWLDGSRAKYGFFFVGPNESVDEKNKNRCLTNMLNLRLEVLVSVDK